MHTMSTLKDIFSRYLPKVNPYWLVTIIFVALTFTAGDSNLYMRYKYDERIRDLEKEIAKSDEEIKANSQKLHDLNTNKEGLERFAREEYLMKRPDEDLFIIKGN